MKRSAYLEVAAVALFFVLLTVLTVTGLLAKEWRPAVASEHGKGVDGMITYLLIATGALFVLGHTVLAWFLWRYRDQGVASYRPVRSRTEWMWAMVPVLAMTAIAEVGVLMIGMPVWADVFGAAPANAITVEVVGQQFEWFARYPGKDGKFGRTAPQFIHPTANPLGLDERDPDARDDIIVRGALHLPVGRAAVIRLRSHDVVHSFSIPELRVKQDIVPGYTGSTKFIPNRAGTFEIACAQLCGLGHYRMRGLVMVMTPEEFERWLAEQEGWFE